MEEQWYKTRNMRKTDKPFLQIRRMATSGVLHIQGFGAEDNRPYGYAEKYSAPDVVVNAVSNYKGTCHYSFASEEKLYFRDVLEIVRYADGHQLIIKIKSSDNNDEGQFVLDMDARADGLINFAEANDLIIDKSDEDRFVSLVGEEE